VNFTQLSTHFKSVYWRIAAKRLDLKTCKRYKNQGWQVFAGLWKKPVFSMEKTVPAKIVLQTFATWKK
jgi:hypothetical protein